MLLEIQKVGANDTQFQKQPLKISVWMFPTISSLVLEGQRERRIMSAEELEILLTRYVLCKWGDGSVASITIPFTIRHAKQMDKLHIHFCCTITNAVGQLQYPLQYN